MMFQVRTGQTRDFRFSSSICEEFNIIILYTSWSRHRVTRDIFHMMYAGRLNRLAIYLESGSKPIIPLLCDNWSVLVDSHTNPSTWDWSAKGAEPSITQTLHNGICLSSMTVLCKSFTYIEKQCHGSDSEWISLSEQDIVPHHALT